MRVDQALAQISEIHEQMAKSQIYRGYRAIPSMLTGVLALVAAWVQPMIVSSTDPRSFVYYWMLVGVAAFFIAGGGVILGYLKENDTHLRRRTEVVVGQLTSCLAVGALYSFAFLFAEESRLLALLPATWSMLYGLGLAASRPFLPRMIGWVALIYILSGVVLMRKAIGLDLSLMSPWDVGLPFGFGHLLGGLILYWNLERKSRETQ